MSIFQFRQIDPGIETAVFEALNKASILWTETDSARETVLKCQEIKEELLDYISFKIEL